jgi:hypothetical protein
MSDVQEIYFCIDGTDICVDVPGENRRVCHAIAQVANLLGMKILSIGKPTQDGKELDPKALLSDVTDTLQKSICISSHMATTDSNSASAHRRGGIPQNDIDAIIRAGAAIGLIIKKVKNDPDDPIHDTKPVGTAHYCPERSKFNDHIDAQLFDSELHEWTEEAPIDFDAVRAGLCKLFRPTIKN